MTITSYALIQQLFEAAREVLAGRAIPETMRAPLEELEHMIAFRESPVGQQVLESAHDLYAGDPCDIDIDYETVVYHNGDGGYWVMGWCYVADCEVTDEPDDNATEAVPESILVTAP